MNVSGFAGEPERPIKPPHKLVYVAVAVAMMAIVAWSLVQGDTPADIRPHAHAKE